MSLVLAAIALIIFAALFVPPYLFPYHQSFRASVSLDSAFGFTLHLRINATSTTGEGVSIQGWLNSTSSTIQNITTSSAWGVDPGSLSREPCVSGWPIGLGVMKGHYDQVNYTLGTLLPVVTTVCSPGPGGPGYLLLTPHSSRALVDIGGTPEYWTLQSGYTFGYAPEVGLPQGETPNHLASGVYTVVLADEWGDVLTTNFSVA